MSSISLRLVVLCSLVFAIASLRTNSVLRTAQRSTLLQSQPTTSNFGEKFDANYLKKVAVATLSSLFLMSQGFQAPASASSFSSTLQVASALENANSKLNEYSLPPMLYVPNGFTPLVSEIGRGNIREAMTNPIVVQFVHPGSWIVQKTSVNVNGEAGTISANDYIKGDSAFLFIKANPNKGPLDAVADKALIKEFILKSLSQKGDPVDALKIYKIEEGKSGVDGQGYLIVDFGYQINTEAGFLIGRRAVASVTNVGDQIQGLIAVTTDKRWRQNGMEAPVRTAAESFRVYKLKSGIFSSGGQINKPASPSSD